MRFTARAKYSPVAEAGPVKFGKGMSMPSPAEAPPTTSPSSTSIGRSRQPPLLMIFVPYAGKRRAFRQLPDIGKALHPFKQPVMVAAIVVPHIVKRHDIAQREAVAVGVQEPAHVQLRGPAGDGGVPEEQLVCGALARVRA